MDVKALLLLTTLLSAVSLIGCQTVKNTQAINDSNGSYQVKQAIWKTSGEAFTIPDNSVLTAAQSRVVVFYEESNDDTDPIKIAVGADNAFQASLQNKHYSDAIICSGTQTFQAKVLKSNKAVDYSKQYYLPPQKTTYLKVDLLETGQPIIEQVSVKEALTLLSPYTRQTHQISRVSSNCKISDEIN